MRGHLQLAAAAILLFTTQSGRAGPLDWAGKVWEKRQHASSAQRVYSLTPVAPSSSRAPATTPGTTPSPDHHASPHASPSPSTIPLEVIPINETLASPDLAPHSTVGSTKSASLRPSVAVSPTPSTSPKVKGSKSSTSRPVASCKARATLSSGAAASSASVYPPADTVVSTPSPSLTDSLALPRTDPLPPPALPSTRSVTDSLALPVTDPLPPPALPSTRSVTDSLALPVTDPLPPPLTPMPSLSSTPGYGLGSPVSPRPTGLPNPLVPTQITDYPVGTAPVPANVYQENLAQAKNLSDLNSLLTPNSACSGSQVACIHGNLARCGSGMFQLEACPGDQKCMAFPMTTTEGVSLGCRGPEEAHSVLGIGAGGRAPSNALPPATKTTTVTVRGSEPLTRTTFITIMSGTFAPATGPSQPAYAPQAPPAPRKRMIASLASTLATARGLVLPRAAASSPPTPSPGPPYVPLPERQPAHSPMPPPAASHKPSPAHPAPAHPPPPAHPAPARPPPAAHPAPAHPPPPHPAPPAHHAPPAHPPPAHPPPAHAPRPAHAAPPPASKHHPLPLDIGNLDAVVHHMDSKKGNKDKGKHPKKSSHKPSHKPKATPHPHQPAKPKHKVDLGKANKDMNKYLDKHKPKATPHPTPTWSDGPPNPTRVEVIPLSETVTPISSKKPPKPTWTPNPTRVEVIPIGE